MSSNFFINRFVKLLVKTYMYIDFNEPYNETNSGIVAPKLQQILGIVILVQTFLVTGRCSKLFQYKIYQNSGRDMALRNWHRKIHYFYNKGLDVVFT